MLKKLKIICNLAFNNLIYFISYFVPKDKNLWIFGAWSGDKYADNSKYLFEYVNQNHPEIKCVWITKNKNVIELLNEKGYDACYFFSLKAYILSMRAGIGVITHSKWTDLNSSLSSRTKIIQCWHGTPLKKIIYDDKISKYGNQNQNTFATKILNYIFPTIFNNYNYSLLIASSDEVKKKLSSAFKIKKDKIKITGYPRNDQLFKFSSDKSKKGIYMPTFREDESNFNLFSKYDFNINRINKFLNKNETYLYIKLHPGDAISGKIKSHIKNHINNSNIRFIEDNVDIYEYLNQFDFLITDYSSIYFDYLLLNRPIIFAPFDIEYYLNEERELYYDYNKVTPGPKAKNWNEILIYLEEFILNPNKYNDDRSKINKVFNKFIDENSSERVFNEIKNL